MNLIHLNTKNKTKTCLFIYSGHTHCIINFDWQPSNWCNCGTWGLKLLILQQNNILLVSYHQSLSEQAEKLPSVSQHKPKRRDQYPCHPTACPRSACITSPAFLYWNPPFSVFYPILTLMKRRFVKNISRDPTNCLVFQTSLPTIFKRSPTAEKETKTLINTKSSEIWPYT